MSRGLMNLYGSLIINLESLIGNQAIMTWHHRRRQSISPWVPIKLFPLSLVHSLNGHSPDARKAREINHKRTIKIPERTIIIKLIAKSQLETTPNYNQSRINCCQLRTSSFHFLSSIQFIALMTIKNLFMFKTKSARNVTSKVVLRWSTATKKRGGDVDKLQTKAISSINKNFHRTSSCLRYDFYDVSFMIPFRLKFPGTIKDEASKRNVYRPRRRFGLTRGWRCENLFVFIFAFIGFFHLFTFYRR